MKKLFSFLFTILLFSSFSNAYLTDFESEDFSITSAEKHISENSDVVVIDKSTLENLQQRFAELRDLINSSTSVNLNLANPKPIYFTNVPLPPRPQSNLDQATYFSKALLKQIESIFKFTLDKADKLTSKKSIIAFFVLAGPFIALYCTYFDINPLRELIGSLFYHSAKASANVGMEALEETGKGIIQSAIDNPLTTTEVVVGGGLLYTGGVMFAQAVKVMAEDAAPHVSTAVATTGAKCLALFTLILNGARHRVSL